MQIAVTLIGILTGVFSGAKISEGMASLLISAGMAESTASTLALTIVVIIVTLVAMLIGELVPKRIGLMNPESVSKVMVPPAIILSKILIPVTWLLTRLSDIILRLLRIKPSAANKVTEEEIRALVLEGAMGGEVQKMEQHIVDRVFHLGDQKIASLMTHYSEVTWLDITDSSDEMWKKIQPGLHSVYPVCKNNLNNVIGVVSLKKLLLGFRLGDELVIDNYIKPAHLILESLTAYETLELFKDNKVHYGLVVDEYGSTVGMVVLNDILEAIVGDFHKGGTVEPQVHLREDGSWLVDGQIPFAEFAYKFGLQGFDKSKVKFNTLAGLVTNTLKHIPAPGEKFVYMGYEVEVVDLDGNRIDKLIIKKL